MTQLPRESDGDPEPVTEPVNLEWEMLPLTGDHPAFAVYARFRDVNEAPEGAATDRAWVTITSSMFSAPPRVLVTPDELLAIASLCRRVASALRAREAQR